MTAKNELRQLRINELGLICAGLVVLLFGYLNIIYNLEKTITLKQFIQPTIYALVILTLHFIVRKITPYADPILLPVVSLLNGIGLLIIFRLDYAESVAKDTTELVNVDRNFYFSAHQLGWVILGAILFALTLYFLQDYKKLALYSYSLGGAGLILLAIPAILPNKFAELNGSKIWIMTPWFNIQPGEFAKVILICFTAAYLMAKQDLLAIAGTKLFGYNVPRAKELAPILITVGVAILVLVLEHDLGTSLLIFCTILLMFYVATGKKGWIVLALSIFMIAAYLCYKIFSHLQERIVAWQDPFGNYNGSGYQLSQSLFSFGTGGLLGTGLAEGQPDLIPEVNSDFILAAIAEELGFWGIAAVMLLFLILIFRGIRIAMQLKDTFGKLLAFGLTCSLAIQLFVVWGGVTKLIPLTGVTTPFISYGGSSLLANWLLLAILIRLSNVANISHTASHKLLAINENPTELVRLP